MPSLQPLPSSSEDFQVSTVAIGSQELRVGIRAGGYNGPVLLIFNGIGANLELLEPFVASLGNVKAITFDVPGVGGSPAPLLPYRMWMISRLAGKLMDKLGYRRSFDVMGLSWGGAPAQQFALQFPSRCRRLVLAATSMGSIMVPGRLSTLSKLVSPRGFMDPQYLQRVGPVLYGGAIAEQPEMLGRHATHMRPPRDHGYAYQLLASAGWTSLPWLPLLRQPTLILAGMRDPIIPVANARIMASLIRSSELKLIDDGHLFLLTRAAECGSLVRDFLSHAHATPMPSTGGNR